MKRAMAWFLIVVVAVFAACLPAAAAEAPDPVTWQSGIGPAATATHLASDPAAPDFLFTFVTQAVSRNPDRTQVADGDVRQTWAPYVSSDGGATWQPAGNDLAYVEPTTVAITKGRTAATLWVGTAADGLWRSDNGGRTWRPSLVRGLASQRALSLVQDRDGRLHLLAVDNNESPNSYLYTSTDGGYNWQQRLVQTYTGSPAQAVVSLLADPFDADRLYVTTLAGLLTSADAGLSWRSIELPVTTRQISGGDTVIAADPAQRGMLYAVTTLDGSSLAVLRSQDSGATWENLQASWSTFMVQNGALVRPTRVRIDPTNTRRLLLATNAGIWVSTDGGQNWRGAGSALEGAAVADTYMHPEQTGRWFAIGPGGLWRTDSSGAQWRSTNSGLPKASAVQDLISRADGELLALGGGPLVVSGAGRPLWRSEQAGSDWQPALRGLGNVSLQSIQAHPTAPDTLYGLSTNGIATSTDGGRSWRHTTTPATPDQLVATRQPHTLLFSAANGLWRSTNDGATWQQTTITAPVPALTLAANGDIHAAVLAGSNTELQRSTDAGSSWSRVGPLPPGEIAELQAHPKDAQELVVRLAWGGLQRSRDGGRSWYRSDVGIPAGTDWQDGAPVTPSGPNLLALFIDPANPDEWWAGRDGGGVYQSKDGGRTWQAVGSDLGDTLITSFARTSEGLFAGTSTLGVITLSPTPTQSEPPPQIDTRVEILWPHDSAPVSEARRGNLGLRLYSSRSLESPPCVWTPTVEVWMARDAQPWQRLGTATQRTVEGEPFPFWELNDVDLTWANDPNHKLVFMARVAPGVAENASSPWVHAADARTLLPEPPVPQGLTTSQPAAVDAVIRVVWPHDEANQPVPVVQANLANISAVLFAHGTNIALAPEHLPGRVWLVGALDNQVGRRLVAGVPRTVDADGFSYTSYEFNNVDVSLARDPAHRWTFWLEVPDMDAATNFWVHGVDGRTRAPLMLEPIAGCRP